jgi:hypothetical protein
VSFFYESTQYNFWSFTDHHTLFNFDVQCEKESQINDRQWIGQENRKNIYEGNKKRNSFVTSGLYIYKYICIYTRFCFMCLMMCRLILTERRIV